MLVHVSSSSPIHCDKTNTCLNENAPYLCIGGRSPEPNHPATSDVMLADIAADVGVGHRLHRDPPVTPARMSPDDFRRLGGLPPRPPAPTDNSAAEVADVDLTNDIPRDLRPLRLGFSRRDAPHWRGVDMMPPKIQGSGRPRKTHPRREPRGKVEGHGSFRLIRRQRGRQSRTSEDENLRELFYHEDWPMRWLNQVSVSQLASRRFN
jgi:hypothetical protein